jgi:hypothetical protein
MSPGAVVAIIFVVIFIIGIGVGVIAVIALSALRAERNDELTTGDPAELSRGATGVPGHWDGMNSDDDRSRWPGEASNGFSGEEP